MIRPRVLLFCSMPLLCVIAAAGFVAAAEVTSKPLHWTEGGTPDAPTVFDGGGLVIDLGIDVTDHPWDRKDDLQTSRGPLPGHDPRPAGQTAGLFIDEVPVSIPRDVAAEKLAPEKKGRCYLEPAALRPGQMAYLDDGSVAFRWPAGKTPGQARIIAPPEADTSGVTIAWNGSAAGGVADVGRSVTSYRECEVHHNLGAAFYFSGRSHRVEDTLIYDQALDFAVQPGTAVERVRVTWRK